MAIEAVVFDRDGVLTSFDLAEAAAYFAPLVPLSVRELGQAWVAWGRARGFPRSLAAEQSFWRGFWESIGERLALPPATRERLHAFSYTSVVRAFPDARPALELVRASGRKTGVLSNFSLASLEPSLAAAGLLDLVDAICAAHVLGAAKPAAEAYHAIARALGCPPAACVMLDDEPACVEGARAAGMRAYLVDRSRADHDLERGVVADCSALAELLG